MENEGEMERVKMEGVRKTVKGMERVRMEGVRDAESEEGGERGMEGGRERAMK